MNRRSLLLAGSAALAAGSYVAPLRALAAVAGRADAAAAGEISLGAGLRVHRMGFGAMRITGPDVWGPPKDPAMMRRLLGRVLDLGVSFIDTADAYGPAVSEELIASALHPYPKGLVIGTKGGIVRPSASEWVANARPEHLRVACHASLKRLRLETFDFYQLHATQDGVPVEDSVGELVRLQREGKIRHIGVSNVTIFELAKARSVAQITAVQNSYSFVRRRDEDVLRECEAARITFIPHTPLARASLHGTSEDPRALALKRVAESRGISTAQAALAWLLTRSPFLLPIPGTSSAAHLEENVTAAGIRLTADEMTQLA